jgi:thiamine-monophosphate kinase
MTPEFNLIKQYFTRPTRNTKLGVGDDAALISLSTGMELAISVDMLVAGTHFFADCDAYQLGWKSLAVNISDMAAMGANPKWATLAIALPEINNVWLAEFSSGFFACADNFDVDLIGGDTTRGPLTISVQIMGEVPIGKAIKRSGAKVADEIWVSGKLGDAALALAHIQARLNLPVEVINQCTQALHAPQPRVELGLALSGLANSAIDISDGLLADLGHILEQSKVGATIEISSIPHSQFADLGDKGILKTVLAGGDDYELCFTASSSKHSAIVKLAGSLGIPMSCIGLITGSKDLVIHGLDGEVLDFKETGFDHFS